jgi:hypothetical protein
MRRSIAFLMLAILCAFGCVQRHITITSEPEGALVYLNNNEIGRTPITTDFTYYGNFDVQLRKEGLRDAQDAQMGGRADLAMGAAGPTRRAASADRRAHGLVSPRTCFGRARRRSDDAHPRCGNAWST